MIDAEKRVSRRLRILHFPSSYLDPSRDMPFSMIFIQEHVVAANLHHDNVILYASPSPPTNGFLFQITKHTERGIPTYRLYTKPVRHPTVRRILAYFALITALLRIRFDGFMPDLIHLHIFSEVRFIQTLARVFRIPTVITEHWSALCREGVLSPVRLKKAKQVYEQSRKVLPVSQFLRSCIENNTGAEFKSTIVHNAVDTSLFRLAGTIEDNKQRKQLITVARLEEEKGIDILLAAFQILVGKDKGYCLHIIGDGTRREEYESLAHTLGISSHVTFHGSKPKSFIAKTLQASDVFVLASYRENSPCVIGEALCCGVPVVATSVGGVPELVAAEDGILVPPGDANALAATIHELLETLSQFDRVSISERACARFSYEAIGRQLDQVYREVVNGETHELMS